MLPNHSPLVIAEQFGTLATLHPGRIDLGLGRAPGSDAGDLRAPCGATPPPPSASPRTSSSCRSSSARTARSPGVRAIPGDGTHVPLYILGSSLFGAQLAASLGLPYAFASHFAPQALNEALRVYRERFQPSAQLERPYVIAGVGAIAAETAEAAAEQLETTRRARAKSIFSRGDRRLSDEDVEASCAPPRPPPSTRCSPTPRSAPAPRSLDYLDRFQRAPAPTS